MRCSVCLQEEYERPRQRAVQSMTAALETLHRVFGVQVCSLAVCSMHTTYA